MSFTYTQIAQDFNAMLKAHGVDSTQAIKALDQSFELYREDYEAYYREGHANDPRAKEYTENYEIVIKGEAFKEDYCPEVYINGELRDVGPHYHLPIDRLAEIVKSYCDGLLQGEIMCRSFGRLHDWLNDCHRFACRRRGL